MLENLVGLPAAGDVGKVRLVGQSGHDPPPETQWDELVQGGLAGFDRLKRTGL